MGPRDNLTFSLKEKKNLTPLGMRAPDPAAVSLVTIPTTLSLMAVQSQHDVIIPRIRSPLKQRPSVKAYSHIACRAHAVPLPCRAAKGLECVFPI